MIRVLNIRLLFCLSVVRVRQPAADRFLISITKTVRALNIRILFCLFVVRVRQPAAGDVSGCGFSRKFKRGLSSFGFVFR